MNNTECGVVDDIHNLLGTWQSVKSTSFEDFKNTWKYMQFSYIHRGSAPTIPPDKYTQALFQITLSLLPRVDVLQIRIGILYALYCLYKTQGTKEEKKERIAITMISWKELLKLYREIHQHNIIDALYIWKLMKDEGVYSFTCREPDSNFQTKNANNSSLQKEVINVDTLSGIIDIGLIEDIANRYENEKINTGSQSYQVIDNSLVDDVKELFQQNAKQQYVALQLQYNDFTGVDDV